MAPPKHSHSFTAYGWTVCVWVLIASFQYGYHISALNQIQAVLTCRRTDPGVKSAFGLPTCIPMSDATFSTVTAIFTVGGLLGSMVANILIDRWGRKGTVRASSALNVLGPGLMTVSGSIIPLAFGRFLAGLGAGLGICVVPIYLSEIAPASIKGNVGVLNQLAIVIGILVTQILGFLFSSPTQWRFVLLASAALSTAHFFLSPGMTESPAWLQGRGRKEEVEAAMTKLWGISARKDDHAESALLANEREEGGASEDTSGEALSVPQVLKAPELRQALFTVSLIMMAQQLSGINAVLYYSNNILSKALPELGPYISLGITVVNMIMTFPPIFLISKLGRRTLLYGSAFGAICSLLAVGYGLDAGMVTLSSVAILAFVTSFAIGMGPVPFVIIPEVSPFPAVSALSTIALSLNWIVNFLVGQIFLPLRNFLSQGDDLKAGRVFYVFAAVLTLAMFAFSRVYRG